MRDSNLRAKAASAAERSVPATSKEDAVISHVATAILFISLLSYVAWTVGSRIVSREHGRGRSRR
ncbi:MAG TPA: hypothetical protein VM658_10285 [bacterium]|nr:hypothetical protein [bacterium]